MTGDDYGHAEKSSRIGFKNVSENVPHKVSVDDGGAPDKTKRIVFHEHNVHAIIIKRNL